MRKKWTRILVAGLVLNSGIACASEAQPGLVGDIALNQFLTYSGQPTEMAFFKTDGTRTAQPACATLPRWAFSVNTPTGQAILATLLTAKATGKKICVLGTGTCSLWADSETPTTVRIQD